MFRCLTVGLCAAALFGVAAAGPAVAQSNIRGDTTGPTTAPGFSHPEQYMHLEVKKPAPNMYPVIKHPNKDNNAASKLAALAQKTGKKSNILIFLLDDVGWMDPGFNGGGGRGRKCDTSHGPHRGRGPHSDIGLLHTLVLADPRHDPHRPEPPPSRDFASADVWQTWRS